MLQIFNSKNAVNKNLGELLTEKKLSKTAVSKLAGISLTTVVQATKEGGRISLDSAHRIATALDVPAEKAFDLFRSNKGLGDKTILHYHRLIGVILGQATRDRLVPYNIADRNYMKGLEWKDIDFDNHIIHIRRAGQYVRYLGVITKDTKNYSSVRSIRLPDEIFTSLREYRNWWLDLQAAMGSKWMHNIKITNPDGSKETIPNDRLFIKDDSTPMNPDSLTAWTNKFRRKYSLPKFSPHSLRHTNASLLIANGVNIPTVSKRLGHSSVATTTKIYSHAIQSADEIASEVLTDKLKPLK
jgi:transcriptional regulator with XRE-family HTH domain